MAKDKSLTKVVNKCTEDWRAFLDGYAKLKELHEAFRISAKEIPLDHAGPGLKVALRMLFHKRRFNIAIEDLLYEDFRRGGLSRLTPPESSTEKEEGESKKKKDLF